MNNNDSATKHKRTKREREIIPMPVVEKTHPPTLSLDGLRLKESPWQLSSWVTLALTLDGRDKITKVFQYTARFLAFVLVSQKERFDAVKVSLTTSRKAYRLLRSLIEVHKLRKMDMSRVLGQHLSRRMECKEEPSVYSTLAYYVGGKSIGPGNDAVLPPLWKVIGSALKIVGLCGFWAGDNINFLSGSGLFDNLTLDKKSRMAERKRISSRASKTANRFYFLGAIAGFVVTLKSYQEHRRQQLLKMKAVTEASSETERDEAEVALREVKEKELTAFLPLLKSCCDFLVFSNNPGLNLWEKYYGKKLHEGFHCVCGLLSASTVLYSNFPNKKPQTSS